MKRRNDIVLGAVNVAPIQFGVAVIVVAMARVYIEVETAREIIGVNPDRRDELVRRRPDRRRGKRRRIRIRVCAERLHAARGNRGRGRRESAGAACAAGKQCSKGSGGDGRARGKSQEVQHEHPFE